MILGTIASSIRTAISDLFTRTTSGSLGTTTSGQVWTALKGIWYSNGSAAQSDDAASTYPIASIPFSTNATIKADVSGGVGAAFWATDSNNWWGAYPFYSSVTNTVSTCNAGYNTFPSPSYCCSGSYTTNPSYSSCDGTPLSSTSNTIFCGGYTTTPGTTTCNGTYLDNLTSSASCCSAYSTTTTYNCSAFNGQGYQVSLQGTSCYDVSGGGKAYLGPAASKTTYACYTTTTTSATTYYGNTTTTTYPVSYSCYSSNSTSSITTYTTSIRIISSVSGAVVTDSTTSITSNTSGYTSVASLEVATQTDTITAKGYSSTGQTTQIGSTVTSTPTTPTKGVSVGIIKAPTDANQGSTLDNYSVTI